MERLRIVDRRRHSRRLEFGCEFVAPTVRRAAASSDSESTHREPTRPSSDIRTDLSGRSISCLCRRDRHSGSRDRYGRDTTDRRDARHGGAGLERRRNTDSHRRMRHGRMHGLGPLTGRWQQTPLRGVMALDGCGDLHDRRVATATDLRKLPRNVARRSRRLSAASRWS